MVPTPSERTGPTLAEGAPRLLLVAGRYPYPERDGADRRVAQLGRALSAFEVDLVVDADGEDPTARRRVDDGFASVSAVPPRDGPQGWAGRAWRRVRRPKFDDAVYHNPALIHRIEELGRDRPYAAIVIETVRLAWLLDALPTIRPHVIDAVDIWSERYRAYAALGRGALLDQYRDAGREFARYCAADLTVAISDHDHAVLRRAGVRESQLLSVPVAFDPHPIAAATEAPELLFAGASGEANEEAAIHFADRVLPLVRRRVPEARLTLLRVPPSLHARFAGRPEIRCRPYLDEIDEAYRDARVVVVPLRRGSGIKIKVLEAFSRGAPTIITPAAAQGIRLDEYAQEAISDDPTVLSGEVVRALTDEDYRAALSRTGLATIERHYRPSVVYAPLVEAIRDRIESRGRASSEETEVGSALSRVRG